MIQVTAVRKKMIDFIKLTEQDLQLLHSKEAEFQQVVNDLVDSLYDDIIKEPELKRIIEEHSTLERLKETQRWYFLSMASGVIDMPYIERRIAIGKIHSRIGLTTDWYLGTYLKYMDLAIIHFRKVLQEEWQDVTYALSKLFNFDSQLVLEAYEQDEKAKIQQLADEQKHTLGTVGKAVQELAAMIVELGSSSEAVADTAIQTAESQEKADRRLQELQEEIKEIDKMGSIMQEISEQTHLLGLNAAIEAARSGEHGRGFEVVANEVRKLAANSKTALEQIKNRLHSITTMLSQVKKESEQTSLYARTQAASAEELSSFVQMVEKVTNELEQLNK